MIVEKYKMGDVDFKAQLIRIKDAKPDAVALLGTATEIGKSAAQAREMGITVPFLGGSGMSMPDYVKLAGKAAENSFSTGAFTSTDDRPEAKAFVNKFKGKFGFNPDTHAAQSWDAIHVVFVALEKAEIGLTADSLTKDREAIYNALTTIKGYKGLTGEQNLGPNATPEDRDANKKPILLEVKNGDYFAVKGN